MSNLVLKQRGQDDVEALARQVFVPGMFLYGYCGGLFGRDSYGDKQIVSVGGDYITVRERDGFINTGHIDGRTHTWLGLLGRSNSACNDPDYGGQDETSQN